TINPGVIWAGTYFQVGAEAVFPVNHASGTGVGFLGQLHLYLDDMFPTTIGRPLLGGSSALRNSSNSEAFPCDCASSFFHFSLWHSAASPRMPTLCLTAPVQPSAVRWRARRARSH